MNAENRTYGKWIGRMVSNGSDFFEIMFDFHRFNSRLIDLEIPLLNIPFHFNQIHHLLDKYKNKNHWNLLIKVDHMD